MRVHHPTEADVPLPATSVGAPIVLLVDDQAIIGEAIRRALSVEADIAFHYCASAVDALAMAERVRPTVILQDLVMPGVDGFTLVRAYRENPATKDIPIVVLSSKEDPNLKRQAFAADVSDYLVKIPDKIELVARIRHHSKSYMNLLQRDAAYRALSESQGELLALNQKLEQLSNVDGLTGLNNRRYLDAFLDTEWKRAMREQKCFSVLLVDVDNFKPYNDTYGHLAGDEVLKRVAASIRQSTRRPGDIAARFGGEEFACILPSTPSAGARHLGEMMCKAVADLNIAHSKSGVGSFVTVSIGAASAVPSRMESPLALLHAADVALYEAKSSGKNRVMTAVLPEMPGE